MSDEVDKLLPKLKSHLSLLSLLCCPYRPMFIFRLLIYYPPAPLISFSLRSLTLHFI